MAPLNPYALPYIPNQYKFQPQRQFSLPPPPPQLILDQTLRSTVFYSYQAPIPNHAYDADPYAIYTSKIKPMPHLNGCIQLPAMPFYPPLSGSFGEQETAVQVQEQTLRFQGNEEGAAMEGGGERSEDLMDHGDCLRGNGSVEFLGFLPRQRRRKRLVQQKWLNGGVVADEDETLEREKETTVMIRNLPNKLTKEELLGLLDAHCREENRKIPSGANAIFSEFNFLYLPIDFVTENNLGYAFVNFTTSTGADRLYRFLHHRNWAAYSSRKICEVTYARFQGLASLLHHFSDSVFTCYNKEFLPVRFIPNRNGLNQTVEEYVAILRTEDRTAFIRSGCEAAVPSFEQEETTA